MKAHAIVFCFTFLAYGSSQAATYSVSASSTIAWKDSSGSTSLTRGDSSTDGDGSIIQIGYFAGVSSGKDTSLYTTADWATFTPFTGPTTAFDTTIGDNILNPGVNAPDGMYSLGISYDDAVNNGLPATVPPEIRLAVRVFDSTSAASGNYNTVTRNSSSWVLTKVHDDLDPPGTDPELTINDATTGLVWEDSANPFKTTLVPEPSSFALLGLGATALLFRRRK